MPAIKFFGNFIQTLQKCRNYLFQAKLSPLILFQKNVPDRNPADVRLMIRDCSYAKADPELVDKIFAGDRKRIKRFRTYLKKGAEGHLLYNEKTWVGYLWTIRIPFRRKKEQIYPRNFTFAGLPYHFSADKPEAFLSFAAEIKSFYRGKGAFLFLIEKSYEQIRSEVPDAVVYSNVEVDNAPSIKSKLKMGEMPIGLYYSMYVRIMGRHLGNIYCSRLKKEPLSQLSLN